LQRSQDRNAAARARDYRRGDDVCADISRFETGARAHVASRILQAVAEGNVALENLKKVGREAFRDAPTMWR
jgi:hypothetical protein